MSSIHEYKNELSKKPNRNPMKQWFITFPQSGDMTREQYAELFPENTYIKVAQETHSDGNFHLHAVIILCSKLSKAKLLKHIRSKLPNDYKRIDIQSVRSVRHAITYLDKEDTSPYQSGDVPKRKLRTSAAARRYFERHPWEYYALMSAWFETISLDTYSE